MEAVERGYSDWVVACDAKIREAEWARSAAEERRKSLLLVQPEQLKAVAPPVAQTTNPPEPVIDVIDVTVSDVNPATPNASTDPELKQVDTDDVVEANDTARDDGGVSVDDSHPKDSVQPSQEQSISDSDSEDYEREGGVLIDVISERSTSSKDVSADKQTGVSSDRDRSTDGESEDDGELPPLPSDVNLLTPGSGKAPAFSPVGIDEEGLLDSSPSLIARPSQLDMEDDAVSLSSSPLLRAKPRASSVTFSEYLPIPSIEEDDEDMRPTTPFTESFLEDMDESPSVSGTPNKSGSVDDQLQQQISDILEGIPAKFTLTSEPSRTVNLNPPDFKMPQMPRIKKSAPTRDPLRDSLRSSMSGVSSRASTPGFTLAPAFSKNPRPRQKSTQQDIKVYHLSRPTGEAPIKLFIRCVGENGERVMVRVGGGWADLGEYLKEYASHHGRRSKGANTDKIEIRDLPRAGSTSRGGIGSSPPSRPASALDYSPMTPLHVKKTRKSFGAGDDLASTVSFARRPPMPPHTPVPNNNNSSSAPQGQEHTPSSGASSRSRSSSRLSWGEADSPMLGLAGPTSKPVEMSEESRAWVESVKEKVRLASGERKVSTGLEGREHLFGEMGKIGGTKRLFRKT